MSISPEEFERRFNSGEESVLVSREEGREIDCPSVGRAVKKVNLEAVEAEANASAKLSQASLKPSSEEERTVVNEQTNESFSKFHPDESKVTQPDGFDFDDPVELLLFLDDDVSSGRVKLHDWQIQIMIDFAKGGITDEYPFQALVRACNGSGKDKYVIAPCAVWLCMRYTFSRCVITSASGDQLDNQTDSYIYQLALAANRKIHPSVWKLNYRYYECLATQSPMKLFATDEPGKAEGYHPLKHGAKMAIFMSEAKSIADDINVAINKCTGYTHRVHASTPGTMMGHFYEYCSPAVSVMRKAIKDIYESPPTSYIQYHITAFHCSHLSRNYIEQCKRDLPGGETGAAYQSQVMAEFGTADEMVVIPSTYIWRAVNLPPKVWHVEPHNTGGLDLSDGGDETCLCVRNGNKHIATIPFRFEDSEDTINFLDKAFRDNGLDHPDAKIYADCVGIGRPMLNRMKRMGWKNIVFVDNRHRASQHRVYFNRGAELWFHLRGLFERGEIFLLKDDKLIKQLAGRYYKISAAKGTHQLLSKPEQKSRGYHSPDRADAFTLCFWNYKSTFVEVPEEYQKPYEPPVEAKPVGAFDPRVWAKNGGNRNESKEKQLNPSQGKNFSVYNREIALHNKRIQSLQKETQ